MNRDGVARTSLHVEGLNYAIVVQGLEVRCALSVMDVPASASVFRKVEVRLSWHRLACKRIEEQVEEHYAVLRGCF